MHNSVALAIAKVSINAKVKKKKKKCEWNCLHLHNEIQLRYVHVQNDDGPFHRGENISKPSIQNIKNTSNSILHSVSMRNEYL